MAVDFNNSALSGAVQKDEIGIEKESLRVTKDGRLADTAHPFSENDANLDRDFCENQVEFISDVFTDSEKLIAHLNKLHDKVYEKIKENDELLWNFSNPPYVSGEDEIRIADFSEAKKSKSVYRRYLADKYGKMKMLFSGIHYNFSFSQDFINNATTAKDELYLELAKKLTKYSWLIVYLTAASPLLDSSYIKNTALSDNDRFRYSSVRCGDAGYWNDFIPILNYNSVDEYVNSALSYIENGLLKSSSELYYPIRLKPKGKNTPENLKSGINHIELRTLDINPFSRVGIFKEDIDFIHLFILWLSSIDDIKFNDKEQITAIKNIKKAALYDDSSTLLNIDGELMPTIKAAKKIMRGVSDFTYRYLPQFTDAVSFQLLKIKDPSRRYANAVRNNYGKKYRELILKSAQIYARGVEKIV